MRKMREREKESTSGGDDDRDDDCKHIGNNLSISVGNLVVIARGKHLYGNQRNCMI